MRTEEECHPQERFLFTDEIFSDETLSIWKDECTSRVNAGNIEKSEAFYKYINWKKSDNEIALFTLYAYADFSVPKKFDCIFELSDPENAIFTDFQLTQSIYEGWLPIENVGHGYKHLCIFSFEEKIPDIFNKLYVAKGKYSRIPKGSAKLGICSQADFAEIKIRRIQINRLIDEHGIDWWKFDEEQENME